MSQKERSYNFAVHYQYKGFKKRSQIYDRITSNFILPFWIKKQKATDQTSSKEIQSTQFQVQDSRYFRFQPGTGFSLLYHEEKELSQYHSYKDILSQEKEKLHSNDKKSLDKMVQLYHNWAYAKLILDKLVTQQAIPELKAEDVIEVGLFEKKQKNALKNPIKKVRYLLLRFRQPSLSQAEKGTESKQSNSVKSLFNIQNGKNVETHEKNVIVSLYDFQLYKKKMGQQKHCQMAQEDYRKICESITSKQNQKLYQIDIKYSAKSSAEQIKLESKLKKNLKEKDLIRLLTINFSLNDRQSFFDSQIKAGVPANKLFQNYNDYVQLSQNRNPNKIDFPFKEFIFRRQKKTFKNHYSLAFQGGGAKGLAYVGAYRALKQIKDTDKKNSKEGQIPVKSIMGSSAGGIIALGVSTGIPDYQLQKVCYKMKAIPSTDRFVHKSSLEKDPNDPFVPRDIYGLQITLQSFKDSLKDLFDQYGLISERQFKKVQQFLQSKQFEVIQEKFIRFLQVKQPTIGQILKYQVDEKAEPRWYSKLLSDGQSPNKKQIKINWEGLLLHGALMKGQAIHNIAAECLLKFFLKMDLEKPDKKQLERKLVDGFFTSYHFGQSRNNIARSILKSIKEHKDLSIKMLNLPLQEIFAFSPEQFVNVLVTIVNRFLVLINSYCHQSNKFLKYTDIKIKPLIDLFGVNIGVQTFLDYSTLKNEHKNKIYEENKKELSKLFQKLVKDYQSLNSILNRVNLINPDVFKDNLSKEKLQINIKLSNLSLKDLLKQIFPDYYEQVSLQIFLHQRLQDQKRYFLALQGAEAINQVIEFFYAKSLKDQVQLKRPKIIEDYQQNYANFLTQMKKITLKQYYSLTGVEMTCTSVDLDDRILRLFNHKSTPDLPVCRCVQMTGSFPVGFKAQKWRSQWGYYNVYLSRRRIQIDLTQHQFTDGGLLANFPIKYLDNADIRRKYFAHEYVQKKTLLYGFGLDFLESKKYIPTESQVRQIMQQNDQAQIAWQDLSSYCKSMPMWPHLIKFVIMLFKAKPGQEVYWSKIYHRIVERIPLLRFLIKIFTAYPNADRNLNLEVFQNRVAVHELERPFAIQFDQVVDQNQNKAKNQLTREQCEYRGSIIQFQKFYGKYISRAHEVIKYERQTKALSSSQQKQSQQKNLKILKNKIDRRIQDNIYKYETISKQFKTIINNKPLDLGVERQHQITFEQNLSELLIQVLLYNLRHKDNTEAVKNFNQKYAYYKFLIVDQLGKSQNQLKQPTQVQDIYQQKLNRANFQALYAKKQFKQISRHLSFNEFHENHYETLIKRQGKFINSLRKGLQKLWPIRLLYTNHSRQRQHRYQAYKKRQQFNKAYLNDERKSSLQQAKTIKDDFSCMRLYDVTEGIKRLTQFLFLSIKNEKFANHPKRNEISKRIINIVKLNNFERLLHKQLQKQQQSQIRRGQVVQIGNLSYLQIIEFIKKNSEGSKTIKLQQQFLHFINNYEIGRKDQKPNSNSINQPQIFVTQRSLQLLNKSYMKKSFRIIQDKDQTQQKSKYQHIQKHQHKDLYLHELKQLLVKLGKDQIINNYQYYFNKLKEQKLINEIQSYNQHEFFKMIYLEQPVSYFIMRQTKKQCSRRLNKPVDQIKPEDIKEYPISNQQQERLQQERFKVQNALFNVLIQNKNNRKQTQIYYSFYLAKLKSFQQQIQTQKNKLVQNELLLNPQSLNKINGRRTQTEENLLQMIKIEAIQYLVRNKLQTIKKSKQQQYITYKTQSGKSIEKDYSRKYMPDYLSKVHEHLYLDMQALFVIIKQTMLLLQKLVEQSADNFNQAEVEKIYISVFGNPGDKSQKCFITKSKSQVFKVYKQIYNEHSKNYAKLAALNVNQIDQLKLDEAFIITFRYINTVAKTYVFFRNLMAYYQHQLKDSDKQEKPLLKLVRLIYQSIRRIHNHKFSLPMFTSDWNLSVKSTELNFKKHISHILNHQNNPKFTKALIDNRLLIFKAQYNKIFKDGDENQQKKIIIQQEIKDKTKKINDYLNKKQIKDNYKFVNKISEAITGQTNKEFTEEHYATKRVLGLIQKIGQTQQYKPYAKDNFEVHLVLQGVNNSNQCIGAYYYLVKQLVEKEQGKQEVSVEKQYIKAVTCSNFHSIFGFLLVLGKDPQTIRTEMYKLKHLAAVVENQANINRYFGSYQFFHNTPNKYAQLLKYLENQTQGLFVQLQKKSKLNFGQNCLKKQFSELRLIFQHEKQSLMSIYQKILDQTGEQIKYIDGKFLQEEKANQISKRYAFNYKCNEKGWHKYGNISEKSIKMFNEIIRMVYKSFGDLVAGIIANSLSNSSLLLINTTNAKLFMKGVIAQRLFTTYKLKQYVISQLKQAQLSPNISLSEFYSIKRTIFLNFTVININDQRFEFLNKVTMPNMPVWAAIIASSSVPFFHKFFQGSKEWEATSSQNFYSFIIEEFFKTNYKSSERITNYVSANYISSLPLQLLTNTAVTKVMFADEKVRYLKLFGLAFNQSYKNPISDMKIPKNFFSLSFNTKAKMLGLGVVLGSKFLFKKALGAVGLSNIFIKQPNHQNSAYKISYPLPQYITSYLGQGSLMKTKETLSESNDNFILKWYYSKLIRLPIKINTLDFHEIVDQNIRNTYNINLPSAKAQQTIERSYEITKSFIDQLNFPETTSKYRVVFRSQIITIHHEITGFQRQHLKISLLNHSKWNQNRYNNFVVQYATIVHGTDPKFKRAVQSEILWLVEESSHIKLRFYYPYFNDKDLKTSKIVFTEFELDFTQLIKRPNIFKDSFDYQLIFGENYKARTTTQIASKQKKKVTHKYQLKPLKMNKTPLDYKQPALGDQGLFNQDQGMIKKLISIPKIKYEVIEQKDQQFKNYYIQRSKYNGLPKKQDTNVGPKAQKLNE